MNYPLISEYIEAIKSAEDNFEELSYLRPVLGDDGLPVMTSGNFAVVFKMKDEQSGKFYAVKCFTKEQEGRTEAYREITKELKDVSSPCLTSVSYLDKELFVDTEQTAETGWVGMHGPPVSSHFAVCVVRCEPSVWKGGCSSGQICTESSIRCQRRSAAGDRSVGRWTEKGNEEPGSAGRNRFR